MKHIPRIIEQKLRKFIDSNIGLLITGVKGCGKTETSKLYAKSILTIDDSQKMKSMLINDPKMILDGQKPRLIDEWQLQPWIFNKVRHAIDDDLGTFILTGSATPIHDNAIHSGAGRFIEFFMRPLSWYELSYSSGSVTLEELFGDKIRRQSLVEIDIEKKIEYIKFGGWPFLLNKHAEDKEELLETYINVMIKKDISHLLGFKYSSYLLKRMLASLARNVSTNVQLTTICNETDPSASYNTISKYYQALNDMYVIEELHAWKTHIRSSVSLKRTPKRYFVDPSLVCTILGLSIKKMKNDFNFIGLLFENEVIKNLQIYAQQIKANLYYYGESFTSTVNGKKQTITKEVDVIMEKSTGEWCAFEIKFGFNDDNIEKGIKSLNNMMSHLDFTKIKKPCSLNIITSDGIAFKRPDGINIIPLCFLKGK